MGAGGVILRFLNLFIRVLQLCAAAVILGIYSYFLAVLADHKMTIATWMRAVEGMSGAACLYALLGSIFTCCLGGIAFFAGVAVVLDVAFVGVMIAIAVLTRDGTQKCTGTVHTPLGTGQANAKAEGYGAGGFGIGTGKETTYFPKLSTACRLEKAVFAVSIIGIFLFVIGILFQIGLARHHKREKRFGPSPANGYTAGTRRPFWRRNKAAPAVADGADVLPGHPTPGEVENGGKFGYGTSAYGNGRY
ncbi:hypothetical protein DTO271G3_5513 [Paecilomyces variotii]|nr:hypothetical protein DTO271G3_5513 [Paecilomyces variotii]